MGETEHTVSRLNDRRFNQMDASEKLVFIMKAFVFFVSGGFVFPTIWVD